MSTERSPTVAVAAYVHTCDACGCHTAEPCTDEEAVKEFGMTVDAEVEGWPMWTCERCL